MSSDGRQMMVALSRFLFRTRTRLDTSGTAVVADAVHRCHVGHIFVIYIVNINDIDISDGAIVVEVVILPATSLIAIAGVTKTVRNSAIETDMRSPIARMEKINTAFPTPVGWRP